MARPKKIVGVDIINRQIEKAQEEVICAKRKYDEATDNLKALLDKKKELQTEELMKAIVKSSHTYEEILGYVRSGKDEYIRSEVAE